MLRRPCAGILRQTLRARPRPRPCLSSRSACFPRAPQSQATTWRAQSTAAVGARVPVEEDIAGMETAGRGARLEASGSKAEADGSGAEAESVKGPLQMYDRWVAEGKLRDDDYQRGIVQSLQNLHLELSDYHPPTVIHPTLASLQPRKRSFFASFLSSSSTAAETTQFPPSIPKGLYLYGDVGSGKTMLMDMFYNTLPSQITSKTRIHFHHFMQDVHKRLHSLKLQHGADFDAIPFVGADIASSAAVLCFDEFQCTDVADAMILRRLLESLMSHGVIMVATSNRHPDELYKNGVQRASFLPCIALLKSSLNVINLDSPTDYRKVPRPSSGVYHSGTGSTADAHAHKWFEYLGDPNEAAREKAHTIWGRKIVVPAASGRAARFEFMELCGSPLSAADYLELCRHYTGFVVTGVPQMDHRTRDLARRFITFLDAAYESKAKLVLTTDVSLSQLFAGDSSSSSLSQSSPQTPSDTEDVDLDSSMRLLMDDLGMDMKMLKNSSIFSGDEERFAFARALSRLSEMGSVQWVEGVGGGS